MNTSNLDAKIARVLIMHPALLELDSIFGRDVPSPYKWAMPFIRMVNPNEPWRARSIPNSFATYARLPSQQIGYTILEAHGWTAHEVLIQGDLKLVYNVRGEDVVLCLFKPGLWETWFGSDPAGDTVSYLPDLFADPKDPRWQRFLASGLGEWPPRLDPDAKDPTAPKGM